MTRGRFISFEGGEGAGKSTQIRYLADALRARGIDVLTTREPGGTPAAEQIRALLVDGHGKRWQPMAETLLHMAARAEHVESLVRPALVAGRWVITDRYVDSTLVYQGLGQQVGEARVMELHRIALDALMPDLTLILDIDPQEGLARAGERAAGEGRYEAMGADFHARLRAGFLALAAAEPERCRLIDASGEKADVARRILAVTDARFRDLG